MGKQFLIDGNIDWKLLRRQKSGLTELRQRLTDKGASEVEMAEAQDITGILHLVDNVQDNAVESGIFTEEEVFGVGDEPSADDTPRVYCNKCGEEIPPFESECGCDGGK